MSSGSSKQFGTILDLTLISLASNIMRSRLSSFNSGIIMQPWPTYFLRAFDGTRVFRFTRDGLIRFPWNAPSTDSNPMSGRLVIFSRMLTVSVSSKLKASKASSSVNDLAWSHTDRWSWNVQMLEKSPTWTWVSRLLQMISYRRLGMSIPSIFSSFLK